MSADSANFEQGMRRAQRSAASAQSGISKSLGLIKSGLVGFASGLSIGLITGVIKGALDYASSLGEVSQQLGVTARDLQVFRYAATQTGISQETMDKSLGKLTITLGQVASGAKAPAAALKAIGLNAQEVARMDTGQAFRAIAEALKDVPDRAQRAAIEVALFGKAGSQLDTLLSGGSGAINELGAAAERLGIVLSDEQIQKADDTADKLAAVQTVLKAKIAGVVADNSEAILQLANAMGFVASAAGGAVGAVASFATSISNNSGSIIAAIERIMPSLGLYIRTMEIIASLQSGGNVRGYGIAGKSVTVKLGAPKPVATPRRDLGAYRASVPKAQGAGKAKGGGGKDLAAEAERQRQEALRDAYQFASDQRRANMDILRSQRDLAGDYIERAKIGYDILEAERAAYVAELDFAVASKDKSKAQADQLLALYDINLALEKQKLATDLETQRQEDVDRLDGLNLSLKREQLERQAGLAETQSERRQLELEILRLAYEEKRQALQRIIDRSKDAAEIEGARRELSALPDAYSADQANVRAGTRGPMEDYLASLPTTAAKAQEALEHLQVQGIEGLLDSALKLSEGLGAAKDSLLDTLKQFFLGMARMELQKGLGSLFGNGGLIASLPKGIPGFHTGGAMRMGGFGGIDRNVVSFNGIPAFRADRGELIAAIPQNENYGGGGRQVVQHWNITTPDADSFRRTGRQIMREQKRGLALS